MPIPLHSGHDPSFTLKLKRPGLKPFAWLSGSLLKSCRISSNTFTYVAGLDLGVLPIGDWSISITLSIRQPISRFSNFPRGSSEPISLFDRAGYNVSRNSEDFP